MISTFLTKLPNSYTIPLVDMKFSHQSFISSSSLRPSLDFTLSSTISKLGRIMSSSQSVSPSNISFQLQISSILSLLIICSSLGTTAALAAIRNHSSHIHGNSNGSNDNTVVGNVAITATTDNNINSNSNSSSQNNNASTGATLPNSCNHHFLHRIEACVQPFSALLHRLDAVETSSKSVQQICLEYKMVLLCLHTAITNCPTSKSLKRVQNKLSSHWVIYVNNLCGIQLKHPNQTENNDQHSRRVHDIIDTPSITYSSHRDSSKIDSGSNEIKSREMTSGSEFMPNGKSNVLLEPSSQMSNNHHHFPSLMRNPDFHRNTADEENGVGSGGDNVDNENDDRRRYPNLKDSEVTLRIINVVQNFNYPPSTNSKDISSQSKSAKETNSTTGNAYSKSTLGFLVFIWICSVVALNAVQ